jgi:hypothetical protein
MPGKIHFSGIGERTAEHGISSLLSKWSPRCSREASGWETSEPHIIGTL